MSAVAPPLYHLLFLVLFIFAVFPRSGHAQSYCSCADVCTNGTDAPNTCTTTAIPGCVTPECQEDSCIFNTTNAACHCNRTAIPSCVPHDPCFNKGNVLTSMLRYTVCANTSNCQYMQHCGPGATIFPSFINVNICIPDAGAQFAPPEPLCNTDDDCVAWRDGAGLTSANVTIGGCLETNFTGIKMCYFLCINETIPTTPPAPTPTPGSCLPDDFLFGGDECTTSLNCSNTIPVGNCTISYLGKLYCDNGNFIACADTATCEAALDALGLTGINTTCTTTLPHMCLWACPSGTAAPTPVPTLAPDCLNQTGPGLTCASDTDCAGIDGATCVVLDDADHLPIGVTICAITCINVTDCVEAGQPDFVCHRGICTFPDVTTIDDCPPHDLIEPCAVLNVELTELSLDAGADVCVYDCDCNTPPQCFPDDFPFSGINCDDFGACPNGQTCALAVNETFYCVGGNGTIDEFVGCADGSTFACEQLLLDINVTGVSTVCASIGPNTTQLCLFDCFTPNPTLPPAPTPTPTCPPRTSNFSLEGFLCYTNGSTTECPNGQICRVANLDNLHICQSIEGTGSLFPCDMNLPNVNICREALTLHNVTADVDILCVPYNEVISICAFTCAPHHNPDTANDVFFGLVFGLVGAFICGGIIFGLLSRRRRHHHQHEHQSTNVYFQPPTPPLPNNTSSSPIMTKTPLTSNMHYRNTTKPADDIFFDPNK